MIEVVLSLANADSPVPLPLKVRGPFDQTLCIEKDSYMDAI